MGIWLLSIWIAGSIEGRLWNPVTGTPVRKANVVVGSTGGVQIKRSVSDVNGRYIVDGLPAGRYRIAAGRAGYLPALVNTVVSLKSDEKRRDVNIAMSQPAAISGHVFDSEGDPLEHVKVTALRNPNGKIAQAGSTETNDKGEYRIAGLDAGTYVLRTSQLEAYAPVFYPAAAELESASAVNVASGSEARDIDLRTVGSPTGEIVGLVHGPARQLITIRIARRSTDSIMWAMPEGELQVVAEGRFAFPKVAPGTYVVSAWAQPSGNSLLWASKEVAVNGQSVEAEITVLPARELQGYVNEPAAVVLIRANGFRSEASSSKGKLVFRNITPGTWEVEVTSVNPDGFLDSVRWGEREILNKPLEIPSGDFPKLQIRIGTDGGVLEGEGGSASITPVDGGRTLDAVAGDDGQYRIRGIRPGKYRLSCTDELFEIVAGAVVRRDCRN